MAAQRYHTPKYLKRQADLFCRLQKPREIFDLLNLNRQAFQELSENPQYQSFKVGKKSGGERHIDNPNYKLKKVQERLNRYLQAVYYQVKSPLAYGFVINSNKEKDRRDILSNA